MRAGFGGACVVGLCLAPFLRGFGLYGGKTLTHASHQGDKEESSPSKETSDKAAELRPRPKPPVHWRGCQFKTHRHFSATKGQKRSCRGLAEKKRKLN